MSARHLQLRPIRELGKAFLGMTKLTSLQILRNVFVLLTLRFRARSKIFVYLAPYDWRMVLVELFCGSRHDFVLVTSQLYWDERATFRSRNNVVRRSWKNMISRSDFVGLNDLAFKNAPNNFLDKHLIYHTVTPEPAMPRLESQCVVIGYAGRLVEEKGVLDLLAAAERFPDLEFHFAGWGPLQNALQRSSAKNVFFHGKLSNRDLYEFYAACDYMTQLSVRKFVGDSMWQDVFGLSVAEALCFGCKPIISNLPAPSAVFNRLAPDETQMVKLEDNKISQRELDEVLMTCTKKIQSFRIPEYVSDENNKEKWRALLT